DHLRADAVFGWRQLRKNKVTSAAAILSLGLAIGASTAAFRLIDAMLLRPLAVAHPERLFALVRHGFTTDGKPVIDRSYEIPVFRQMRAAVATQAELIGFSFCGPTDITYGSDQEMERPCRQYVSGWMFPTLGLRPAVGRLLTEEDDIKSDGHPVAVLSYDYWTRRFGRDPHVVGRTFRAGKRVYEIVGVAEEHFTGLEPGRVTAIFVPSAMHGSMDDV